MLVLTRNIGQKIILGDDREIEIIILGVTGRQVRVGVKAPFDTPVHREEIYKRIQAEKKEKDGNK